MRSRKISELGVGEGLGQSLALGDHSCSLSGAQPTRSRGEDRLWG